MRASIEKDELIQAPTLPSIGSFRRPGDQGNGSGPQFRSIARWGGGHSTESPAFCEAVEPVHGVDQSSAITAIAGIQDVPIPAIGVPAHIDIAPVRPSASLIAARDPECFHSTRASFPLRSISSPQAWARERGSQSPSCCRHLAVIGNQIRLAI